MPRGRNINELRRNPEYFYYKKDRLNQLRGFCYTVQCGCCAKRAAEKMNVEPGSVNKQITSLERDLGIDLFDKKIRNKSVITEDGRRFYEKAIVQLQGVDGLFNEFLMSKNNEYQNTIKIASIDVILNRLLPYVANFKNEYPNTNITLLNISKDEALRKLIKKEIDLVFYPIDVDEKYPTELEIKMISNYSSYWVMYPDHPLAKVDEKLIKKEQIASYPFGFISESVYIESFDHFIKDYKLKCPIDLKGGSIDMLKTMVRSKMCISALDSFYITEQDKKDFVFKSSSVNLSSMFHCSFSNKNTIHKDIADKFLKMVEINEKKIFHY